MDRRAQKQELLLEQKACKELFACLAETDGLQVSMMRATGPPLPPVAPGRCAGVVCVCPSRRNRPAAWLAAAGHAGSQQVLGAMLC